MGRNAKRALAALLIAATAAAVLLARAEAGRAFERVVSDEDRYYLPPASWLRAFSAGFNEAVADLVWVTTIVYFGERVAFASKDPQRRFEPGREESAKHTVNYLAVVTSLDPMFRNAYDSGSRLTLYHKGRITRPTVDMAIELLERGIGRFPDDGGMTFTLGFLYYYELEPFLPPGSEEMRRAKARGTELIARAAHLPGVPAYVALTSSSLLRREGLDDLVIEHLRAMLLKETEPLIRASLEEQLRRALGAAAERDIAIAARLERRWRDEMPFVPFDLFLMLQPEIPWSARGVTEPETLGPEGPGI